MIYLKPLGGLCNRLRTIDSLYSLCKTHNIDLTILWITDKSLNAPFEKLFQQPSFKEFKLTIINCPEGFPEKYFFNPMQKLVNRFKGRKINNQHEKVLKHLNEIPENLKLVNSVLKDKYDSKSNIESLSSREMDTLFLSKIQNLLNPFAELKNSSGYISSCYRLYPLENRYTNFIPQKYLTQRILRTTDKFNNTIGIHIRKSDHETSKKFSTTDKFVDLINQEIEINPSVTFFLSTDDNTTKESLLTRYPGRISYNEISDYDRNSSTAVMDAVVDLYCLSKTKKLYGSHHSSFSQVASEIGGIEEITAK